MRRAITTVQLGKQEILMGNLQFQNEVGLTTFNIKNEGEKLLEITLEIFPSKLDYKNDYQKLLEEVNEEIYNLAYHFIRKTYLGAKLKLEGKPSKAEFYRLIQQHFQQFLKATNRIEQQPHHQLRTTHEKTRGDQIRKIDSVGRNYLKKRPHLFAEVDKGIPINNKQLMPVAGLQVKKELTYDTNENRYVKWMMERLIDKLQDLVISIDKQNNRYSQNNKDPILIKKVNKMINQLKAK